jgi:nucleotide-binding universal stress UspA family protein
VVFGRVPSAVVADAIASNSSLIVAAAGQIEGRTFPHGYSTSIGLMAASTLPVMVVPNHWNHLHNYDHLKVLVADDLTDHSRGAISLACEFAANFPGSEVMHLHICKSSTADIKNWGDEILAAMTKGTVPMDEGFNQEKFLAKVGKSYKDTLESRLGTAKLLIEQSGAYKPAVAYGDPFAEFGKAVDKFNPDIVVFGRHEFFHARPFGIGKMPFHAMLGLNRPVVISPTPAHKL